MNTLVQFPNARKLVKNKWPNLALPLQHPKGGIVQPSRAVIWSKNSFALNNRKIIHWFLALDNGLLGNEVYEQARIYGASDQRAAALKRLYRVRNHPYILVKIKELRNNLP